MPHPIYDYILAYSSSAHSALCAPYHRGVGQVGAEGMDFDVPERLIRLSESEASNIFGANTFYSTSGAAHAMRAMLQLVTLYAAERGRRPLILAPRNVGRAFLSALCAARAEVEWLRCDYESNYLELRDIESAAAARLGAERDYNGEPLPRPAALYVTSPDHLGRILDISALSEACHEAGILLIVDNSHGAYLKFLPSGSRHPIDMGADMCVDSASETLPVLCGGAYLHISHEAPALLAQNAARSLSLFGPERPSGLVLASLDMANDCLSGDYSATLAATLELVLNKKQALAAVGFCLVGDEPMRIAISALKWGYRGTELAELMHMSGIECDYADRDYIVFSPSSEGRAELDLMCRALLKIPKNVNRIGELSPLVAHSRPRRVMSVGEALMLPAQEVSAEEALGEVIADIEMCYPPAVPIIMPGERVDAAIYTMLKAYGIKRVRVLLPRGGRL